jgi:hypothetical protein
VDASGTLQSIAGLLPGLPDESVESLLVTFDALVEVSDDALRPAEAQLLRDAAEASHQPARRDWLLRAAAAVEAGLPCALTPEGLTAKQAAAAQTATQAEWESLAAHLPPPPLPDSPEPDDSLHMDNEPPKLPHLPVRHFFPGLVVRVGRDFVDAFGRATCAGNLLKLIACEREESGYALTFLDRIVRLNDDAILDNAGNAWFQPVPTAECLEDLLDAIDLRMSEAEEDTDDNEDNSEVIHDEIEACGEWLSRPGERGPAPQCRTGRLAAKVFGRDSDLAVWIPFFFAAIAVCTP